jgi:hypothetical protein
VGRLILVEDCTGDLQNQMKKDKENGHRVQGDSTPSCLSHSPTTLHWEGISTSGRQNRHYKTIECLHAGYSGKGIPQVPQRT